MWTIEPPTPRQVIVRIGAVFVVLLLGIVAYHVLTQRSGPPESLSASEAVDLACFQGWPVAGAPAYVPQARGAFVADLSYRDTQAFLQQSGSTADLPSGGPAGFLSHTFVVVIRGAVTAGPSASDTPRGQGLVLVVDPAGTVHFVGIGGPWDTLVPPNAQPFPAPLEPSLTNVSRARARIELAGAPMVELAHPPGGLSLRKIAINRERLPVDPTAAGFPGRSLTLTYVDRTGFPHLWLSQSIAGEDPVVPNRPLPQQPTSGVTHYAFYAGVLELDAYVLHRRNRALYLAAQPGPDLSLETITQTVLSLTDLAATPTVSYAALGGSSMIPAGGGLRWASRSAIVSRAWLDRGGNQGAESRVSRGFLSR
jgi:hypothetical protein